MSQAPKRAVWPLLAAALLLGVAGCAGNGRVAVPEKNQKIAEEQYGQQQMFMSDMNATPSEQAAARHDNATRPVEQPTEKRPTKGE